MCSTATTALPCIPSQPMHDPKQARTEPLTPQPRQRPRCTEAERVQPPPSKSAFPVKHNTRHATKATNECIPGKARQATKSSKHVQRRSPESAPNAEYDYRTNGPKPGARNAPRSPKHHHSAGTPHCLNSPTPDLAHSAQTPPIPRVPKQRVDSHPHQVQRPKHRTTKRPRIRRMGPPIQRPKYNPNSRSARRTVSWAARMESQDHADCAEVPSA